MKTVVIIDIILCLINFLYLNNFYVVDAITDLVAFNLGY